MVLPDEVWIISMWWRWAAAVRYGFKTIETRRWPWRHGPAWIVIHAAKQADGTIEGRLPFPVDMPDVAPGALCCLVHTTGGRRLEVEDRGHALVWAPGLHAIPLDMVVPLRAVKMPGPRRLARIPKDIVLDAMEMRR